MVLLQVFQGCLSTKQMLDAPSITIAPNPTPKNSTMSSISEPPPKAPFHQKIDTKVYIETQEGKSGKLLATVYRPEKKIDPKKVVIIVPGSGSVSRDGELSSDGITTYEEPLKMSMLWGEALSNAGIFALAYDKRTCQNDPCEKNDQSDIDTLGIKALANDLDQVCQFVDKNVGEGAPYQLILLGSGQATQVITASTCVNNASGVVLLTPIIADLEKTLIEGFLEAGNREASRIRQNNLKNQGESYRDFFANLRKGAFKEDGFIRGASVVFWRSWLSESEKSVTMLNASKKATLILYQQNDPFMAPIILDPVRKQLSATISLRALVLSDRSLVENKTLSQKATHEVIEFINKNRIPAQKIENKPVLAPPIVNP